MQGHNRSPDGPAVSSRAPTARSGHRTARTLATGLGKAEGPIARRRGDVVVTSNSLGRLYRLAGAEAELYAETGGGANGAAEGADGAIYVAQSGRRPPGTPPSPELCGGVQVVAPGGGAVSWLTRDPVAPNDICFGPDGALWLTDPTRGRRDDGRLWRCDPATGESELVVSLPWYPNGLAFAPDDALFVAATGRGEILRFPCDGATLGRPEVAVRMARGEPDGLAFDADGNLLVAALSFDGTPGEVQVFSPDDGALLDALVPGTSPTITNVALTPERTLVVTEARAGTVYAFDGWPAGPLRLHPFRATAAAS